MMTTDNDYQRTCFIIMPYGKREVAGSEVDFDLIYREIFRPAIKKVRVNRRPLIPKRADDSSHSRPLVHAMVQALLQARLTLVDLSVGNVNVGIELGYRWAVVPTGNVLVRLAGTATVFDIRDIQTLEYAHIPEDAAENARGLITKTLRETLRHNEVDSPFYIEAQRIAAMMGPAENPTKLGVLIVDAEEFVLRGDLTAAIRCYREVAHENTGLAALHHRYGGLLQAADRIPEAAAEFEKARRINPGYLTSSLGMALPAQSLLDLQSQNPFSEFQKGIDSSLFQTWTSSLKDVDIVIQGKIRPDGCLQTSVEVGEPIHLYVSRLIEAASKFGKVEDIGLIATPSERQVLHGFNVLSPKSKSEPTTLARMASEFQGIVGVQRIKVDFGGGSDSNGGFSGGAGAGGCTGP